jgi:hypothetical protein
MIHSYTRTCCGSTQQHIAATATTFDSSPSSQLGTYEHGTMPASSTSRRIRGGWIFLFGSVLVITVYVYLTRVEMIDFQHGNFAAPEEKFANHHYVSKIARSNSTGSTCSCWTETINTNLNWKDPCCRRTFVGVHKGGHLLINQYRQREFPHVTNAVYCRSKSKATQRLMNMGEGLDYREVAVARDWFEMIISGYLYHKSGRECWLDLWGNLVAGAAESAGSSLLGYDWQGDITNTSASFPWPLSLHTETNRSLCRYLADVSEEDGLLVYTSFALARWLLPFRDYIQSRRRYDHDSNKRTLYVHMNELDPFSKGYGTLTNRLGDFFGPGTDDVDVLLLPMDQARTSATNYASLQNHSGHDTSHDVDLRGRLEAIIRDVDATVWNHVIAENHEWPPKWSF